MNGPGSGKAVTKPAIVVAIEVPHLAVVESVVAPPTRCVAWDLHIASPHAGPLGQSYRA
jgi:hypothetical protein